MPLYPERVHVRTRQQPGPAALFGLFQVASVRVRHEPDDEAHEVVVEMTGLPDCDVLSRAVQSRRLRR